MKIFFKLWTVSLGIILILLTAKVLTDIAELNTKIELSAWSVFAIYLGMLLLMILGIYLIYMIWLANRITELQIEYDEIIAYDNTPEFQIKLTKGGKLKGYKEILDYIKTH